MIDNGIEGLDAIEKDDYDLIFLDIAMPDFSGLDIIRSLKDDGLFQSKNIVIFTASSDQKVWDEIKNYGAKEVLKKPCSLDTLAELINRHK
jgi:two-component system, OmpR family, response regulator